MISSQPDPAIDNFIFHLRFLDSFVHTWWVEQVLFPEKKLEEVRAQLILKDRQIRQMLHELKAKCRQLIKNNPMHQNWPSAANIAEFSYSKLSHFALFRGLPFQSYNVGDPDPAICDLKVYQDYLTYCFIRRNVPAGSRILEVGGGDSRVLKHFSKDYECWNADKCEGLGNGPIKFTSPHYRIVYDYIGFFNPELPDRYFDFVFSISALEHTPEDQGIRVNVLEDINRVLKPGCPSFHCFDAILRPAGNSWVNGLIPYLYASAPLETQLAPLAEIEANPDTFAMSRQAYEANWMPITKGPYEQFGRAFSINLLWIAP